MIIWALACALVLIPALVAQNLPAAGSTSGSQAIAQQELIPEHGPQLRTARTVEILLRDRRTLIGRITGFGPNTLNLRLASAKDDVPVEVPVEGVIAVRYQTRKASRLRVIAGGILGGIGGFLVGTPIAFAIGSDTSETAAIAVFLALPAAGAWAGTKLAGRSKEWKTLIVQK